MLRTAKVFSGTPSWARYSFMGLAWWALAALAACDGGLPAAPEEDDPEPDVPERTVVRVRIEPASASLPFVGSTVRLRGQALDDLGYAMSDVPLQWHVADPTVVSLETVDARTVELTALTQGGTQVTAEAAGKSGTATLTVESAVALQNECMSCHWSRQPGGHFSWGFAFELCGFCHDTSDEGHGTIWDDHAGASGGFRVVDAHVGLPCQSCHVSGTTATIHEPVDDQDCVACHRADYDGAHNWPGDPAPCLDCHDGLSWLGATFDHQQAFALSGPHLALACESCHGVGGILETASPAGPSDCIACHGADYERVHAGSGYPESCLDCHDGTTWQGATFDHDALAFPIYSGTHANRWSTCADCHTSGGGSAPVSCLGCHGGSGLGADHRSVAGFEATTSACLSCHPTGNA